MEILSLYARMVMRGSRTWVEVFRKLGQFERTWTGLPTLIVNAYVAVPRNDYAHLK